MSRLGAVDLRPVPAAPPIRAGEGMYPAVCVFALVFLVTLPLTALPDEALSWRLAGFAVAGMAAGWMSASLGAALLGLAAGHVAVLLFPDQPPGPTAGYPYAAAASALLGAGMWIGRILQSWLVPRPAAGAPFVPPPALVRLAGVVAGLFPFAFSRPHASGGDATLVVGIAVGFAAMVLLGALSPGKPGRAWGWMLLGHWPFLTLALLWLVIPGLIDLALTYSGVWLGSALAEESVGAVPKPAPAPVAARHDRGGRMG